MRDNEKRIGALERDVSVRDSSLQDANAAKVSIGIELAQSQKRVSVLESELEQLTAEVQELRTSSAGSSGELAALQARIRDAEEAAVASSAEASSLAATVKKLKQELEASREQLTQVTSRLREALEERNEELAAVKASAAKGEVCAD